MNRPSVSAVLRLSSLTVLLLGCASSHAAGPLRGNPVDSIPPIDSRPQPPEPAPAVQAPTPEQLAVQARLAQRIVVRNFDVSGVNAIPFDEVSNILAPLSGKEMAVGDLVKEVDKITELYRARGYPLSFALLQNQTFANGLVVVTVVEGYIGSVQVNGEDLGGAKDRLETLAGPLLEEKPLTQPTLERVLNLMRIVPGVAITPALELPRRADGSTELRVDAKRTAFTANGGVADLGTGMQPLVNLGTNSLTPLGEQLKLTAALPFNTDDVRYYSGEARIPIGRDGLALKIDGYHYQARPEDDNLEFLGFDRKVTTDRIGVGVSYPLLLNNQRSLTGTVGVYAVNAKDRYDVRTNDRWLQQNTRVRAATAELRYIQVDPNRSTDVTASVSHGFDGLGADKSIVTNYGYSATPAVDLDFTRFNLSARQTFALPAQFGLVFAGAGQYTSDRMPTSEQVSYGSWRFGMGYPQGEQSGDKGVGVSAELNRRFNTGWQYLAAVQPYVLVDYARTWYNNQDLQDLNDRHLSSAALGLRVTDDRFYLFDFNVAKPMGSRPIGDDRGVRFNANYSLFYDAL
ncbi:ShlB/FhaC/HecB family hemolysin secretion/activation protein [Bordetella genomosp. 13]|uniref:ShlB/FhaC/HecB family hemolysin secretion/activation protein n=1 Tax=Bordetella genomosp. 13 TaxID=463040 RepID=UPI00119D9352|nr:ShlB/FhaC/HecB family hemolysin secretion/activation protein [Bordetella genomosp. 13]